MYDDVDRDGDGDHAHGMVHDNHNDYSHLPHNDHVLFQDNYVDDDNDRGNDVHRRDASHDQELVNALHDHSYEMTVLDRIFIMVICEMLLKIFFIMPFLWDMINI